MDLFRLLLAGRLGLLHLVQLELQQLVLLSQGLVLLHAEAVELPDFLLLVIDATSPWRAHELRVPQLLCALVELGSQRVVLLGQRLSLFCQADGALDDSFQLRDPLLVGEEQRRHHLHVRRPWWEWQVVIRRSRRCGSGLLVAPQLPGDALGVVRQLPPLLGEPEQLYLQLWLRVRRQRISVVSRHGLHGCRAGCAPWMFTLQNELVPVQIEARWPDPFRPAST
mmetsp:Transcript_38444/g.69710  ORF Transcript_38444/g.69710 Transcript_38444/m.69710 type:complete len:224 (+) Transcript_38444:1433-2104(+)